MIKEALDKITTVLFCFHKKNVNKNKFCHDNMRDKILSYSLTYGDLIKPEYYPWDF